MLTTYFRNLLAQLAGGEEGQTAIEYVLVIALVSVVVCGIVAGLFLANGNIMTSITKAITDAL